MIEPDCNSFYHLFTTIKHTIFTLLTALAAVPSFAGNLNESDWIISESAPNMVTFNQDTIFTITNFTITSVPEPATTTLSLLALCGLATLRCRK